MAESVAEAVPLGLSDGVMVADVERDIDVVADVESLTVTVPEIVGD